MLGQVEFWIGKFMTTKKKFILFTIYNINLTMCIWIYWLFFKITSTLQSHTDCLIRKLLSHTSAVSVIPCTFLTAVFNYLQLHNLPQQWVSGLSLSLACKSNQVEWKYLSDIWFAEMNNIQNSTNSTIGWPILLVCVEKWERGD